MNPEKLQWTDSDTQDIKEYKSKVRAGDIKPMNYTGNLKDILVS